MVRRSAPVAPVTQHCDFALRFVNDHVRAGGAHGTLVAARHDDAACPRELRRQKLSKQASKQTNKQTNKRAKQTNKQTSERNKQTTERNKPTQTDTAANERTARRMANNQTPPGK
jgi:hypothetical protein